MGIFYSLVLASLLSVGDQRTTYFEWSDPLGLVLDDSYVTFSWCAKNWYVPISLYVIGLVHRPDRVPDQAVCHRKVPLKLCRVGKGTYSVPAHRTQKLYDLHFLGPYNTTSTTPHPPNLYGSSDLHIIEFVTVRTAQTCQRLCVGQDCYSVSHQKHPL